MIVIMKIFNLILNYKKYIPFVIAFVLIFCLSFLNNRKEVKINNYEEALTVIKNKNEISDKINSKVKTVKNKTKQKEKIALDKEDYRLFNEAVNEKIRGYNNEFSKN